MFSLCNVIWRKLAYPLPATTFMENKCTSIMHPILQQGLPTMGMVCTFPSALAHGLLSHQGLNIPNLLTEPTIAHIEILLKYHNQLDNPTGILLWATRKAMQLETCLTGFEALSLLQEFITNSWMTQTWLSAATYNIHLQRSITDFLLQWVHDLELVKLFLCNLVRQPQLSMLNHCHMFLNVLCLSDICNSTRNQII